MGTRGIDVHSTALKPCNEFIFRHAQHIDASNHEGSFGSMRRRSSFLGAAHQPAASMRAAVSTSAWMPDPPPFNEAST
eukprot:3289709-Amphidinium_carterae.1